MALISGDSFPSSIFLASGASSRAASFFLYCLRYPSRINISIASLRWMQSSILCPWLLWNLQHLLFSVPGFNGVSRGKLNPACLNLEFAHLDRICSLEVVRGCSRGTAQRVPCSPWGPEISLLVSSLLDEKSRFHHFLRV